MSQNECSTETRMYTKTKTKEKTTCSAPLRQRSATEPIKRQCANRARHTKRTKTKSPFCLVHKTHHLDNWILHKTYLKHCNFLNRKFSAQSFPHGTSWQQQWDKELIKTQQIQTNFKRQQQLQRALPDWVQSLNCVHFSKSPDSSAPSVGSALFSRNFHHLISRKMLETKKKAKTVTLD